MKKNPYPVKYYRTQSNSRSFPWITVLVILAAMILLAFVLSGCYTQKKATEQTQKALIKYPGVVADVARTAFPCVTTKADTIITTQDSLIYIDCPDNGNGSAADYAGKDTVVLTKIVNLPGSVKTIRVPVTVPVRTITVIQKVKDSAEIYLLEARLKEQTELTMAAQKEVERLEGKVSKKNKWILWLLIAFGVSAFLNYIQFKRK